MMSANIQRGVSAEIRGNKGLIKSWGTDVVSVGNSLFMWNEITLINPEYPYDETTLKKVLPGEISFGV